MVTSTVRSCGFSSAGHFLQQFCAGLNFARVFAEVQHRAPEFAARQFILLTVRANQRTAIDIKFPAVEFVAIDATTLFADRAGFMVRDNGLRARMVNSRGLNGLVM